MLEVLKLLQLRKCRENEQLSDPAAKLRKGSSEEPDPSPTKVPLDVRGELTNLGGGQGGAGDMGDVGRRKRADGRTDRGTG